MAGHNPLAKPMMEMKDMDVVGKYSKRVFFFVKFRFSFIIDFL